MRYFTRGHANGEHSDAEYDEVVASYRRHLEEISAALPLPLRSLATDISLHDAVIERITWQPATGALAIALVAFRVGVPNAYDSVVLEYGGAMLGEARVDSLRAVARDREAQILDFEVDIDDEDGRFIHRLLFWPREEVAIDFRTFDCQVTPREGFAVELGGSFLVLEPEDEDE